MARLTDVELDKKDTIDAVRTALALKYRILKRAELNAVENDILDERERRLNAGQPFQLDVASILGGLDDA